MSIDIQKLAKDLLPEAPPYIVRASAGVPAVLPGSLAATGRCLDVALMDRLKLRGEWHDRAPLIYVDDIAIRKLVDGENGDQEMFNHVITAALVHEIAHIAEAPPDTSPVTKERSELAIAAVAFSVATVDGPPLLPFYGHGERFVRGVIHLAYRAATLGFGCPINFVYCPEAYHLPPPRAFQYALKSEPANLANISIFDIHNFQPPAAFNRLWESCTARWKQQHPETEAPCP